MRPCRLVVSPAGRYFRAEAAGKAFSGEVDFRFAAENA
jgi:hypothetical protein